MSRIIIHPDPANTIQPAIPGLKISELFCDTVQGEGRYTGTPAVFLRLMGCPVNCKWCDTSDIWRSGVVKSTVELLTLFQEEELFKKFEQGHHLVITGGSPLLQQKQLIEFLRELKEMCPSVFVELENEGYYVPDDEMFWYVDQWNISPKLLSMGTIYPYFQKMVSNSIHFKGMENADFKFVVEGDKQWDEIKEMFLDKDLIEKNQIILMPLGAVKEELERNREKVVELAVREGVRFSDRLQVTVWSNKKSV